MEAVTETCADPLATDDCAISTRQRSATSIYGTAYLWTAGLMNLLLLLDIWDIAVGRKD